MHQKYLTAPFIKGEPKEVTRIDFDARDLAEMSLFPRFL